MNGKHLFLLIFLSIFLLSACQKEKMGGLSVFFSFSVDNQNLTADQRIYTNAAGNRYEVNEVMFFVSNVCLHKTDGTTIQSNEIHYVDYDIFTSKAWGIKQAFPVGEYDAISFTFGLPDAQNTNYRFVNPPECDMYWPEVLGGGYHYMKINGKWEACDGNVKPFNLHSGRGQIYDDNGNVVRFIDNSFTVTIRQPLAIKKSGTQIQLVMDINRWFDSPNIFDFDYWGGSIMQNQQAQEILKENGPNVWSINTL